jgi:hypothetical protein
MDMTSVWVAEHGWCYLNAIIDCCTREICGWALDVRCRASEAAAVVDHAVATRAIRAGELTLGTDNGTALTARAFRARLAEHGITHRRGGYRDPESQAFIESWFSKPKQRCVWREEFETLEQAREVIGAHIDGYHQRPDCGAGLPHAARGRGHLEGSRRPANPSGLTSTPTGSRPEGQQSGRERDSGARINQALEGQRRAAGPRAPDACSLTRPRLAPADNLPPLNPVDDHDGRPRARKIRPNHPRSAPPPAEPAAQKPI